MIDLKVRKSLQIRWSLLIVFAILGLTASHAQRAKQRTTFGSEMDMLRPAKIPIAIFRQFAAEDWEQLEKCQNDADYPNLRKTRIADHFVGSLMKTQNGDGGLDLLVVRSDSGCFNGAHNARFWLFFKRRGAPTAAYKLRFKIQADALDVAAKSGKVYPDLDVFSHTATKGFTSVYRYGKRGYRVSACYEQELGNESERRRRVKCRN